MVVEPGRAWEVDRTTQRYPDPAVEVVDPRFRALVQGHDLVERLWTGGRWLEGPVWFGDGRYLLFSDIPNDRVLRWDEQTGTVSVFRQPSQNANGHTRDRLGRLVSCEHGTRRVTRTEHDGSITVLMDSFEGNRLNAPNDVVVHSDGAVWFTDPGWGIEFHYEGEKAPLSLPQHVYRIDPATGAGRPVITGLDRPNGLAFSPDESRLYVVEVDHVRAFDMPADGGAAADPADRGVLVDMAPGQSDGIRVDRAGNIWSAAGEGGPGFDGVHCYAPDGTLLGRVHLPETCANLTFGGLKKNRLFMTASRSLYSVFVETLGAQTP